MITKKIYDSLLKEIKPKSIKKNNRVLFECENCGGYYTHMNNYYKCIINLHDSKEDISRLFFNCKKRKRGF